MEISRKIKERRGTNGDEMTPKGRREALINPPTQGQPMNSREDKTV